MYNLGSNKTPSWSLWGKGLAADLRVLKALALRFARLTLFQPALLRGFLGNGWNKAAKNGNGNHGIFMAWKNHHETWWFHQEKWRLNHGRWGFSHNQWGVEYEKWWLTNKNCDISWDMEPYGRHQTWLQNSPQMCGFPAMFEAWILEGNPNFSSWKLNRSWSFQRNEHEKGWWIAIECSWLRIQPWNLEIIIYKCNKWWYFMGK